MRVLCLYCALFLAVVVAACGGDEPVSVSEPQTQTQRASEPVAQQEAPGQSAAQASRRPVDVDRAAESEAEPAAADEPEEAPPAEASSAEETAQVSEQPSPEAAPARTDDQAEEARPEPRQHPLDRTDVPAAVVQDADVRMRPGLAWPVMDRLESGASVAVLQHADGWYRIRFGGDLEGWIRTTMLDLGRVGQRQVLEKPAPPLNRGVAGGGTRGDGVVGRRSGSPAAEDRRRNVDNHRRADRRGEPAGWRRHAARPAHSDCDETVIFPEMTFASGRGRFYRERTSGCGCPGVGCWLTTTPTSGSGVRRRMSWNSSRVRRALRSWRRMVGIWRSLICALVSLDCGRDNSVLIIPLDGTQRIAFVEDFRTLEVASSLGRTSSGWNANLEWSKNSKAVMLRVALFDRGPGTTAPTTLLFHVEGHMIHSTHSGIVSFENELASGSTISRQLHQRVGVSRRRHDATAALCVDIKGDLDLHTLVFTFTGDFLRFEPFESGGSKDEDVARIRSVEGGDTLEEPNLYRVVTVAATRHGG